MRANTEDNRILRRRKRNLAKRLEPKAWPEQARPMLRAQNIRYEMAERTRAIPCGGIGAFHVLAERGERVLFDDIRCFFTITNIEDRSAAQIVLLSNDRCNQENLIEQLKNGLHALRMPVGDLVSN